MNVFFQDLQQIDNSMNGERLQSVADISQLFRGLSNREPFLFELRGDNGFMLTIGFAGTSGSVQYSHSDGSPPYLMALADNNVGDGFVDLLAGNTPTPMPQRFLLPTEQVENIACYFMEHGSRSSQVAWEEI